MSFTYLWSNYTSEVHGQDQESDEHKPNTRTTPLDLNENICSLLPAISLQADVLFPNAYASTCSNTRSELACVGCKGHQVDEQFPLIVRTPSALPLVQYRDHENNTGEMCSLPVMNWESYIHSLKKSVHRPYVSYSKRKTTGLKTETTGVSEKDDEVSGKKIRRPCKRRHADVVLGEEIQIPTLKGNSAYDIPLSALRKFKNMPQVRVEGTWNFSYNHGGACEWILDNDSNSNKILLVGKGSSLRAVKLCEADSSSVLSFSVKEVWDESCTLSDSVKPAVDDQIFQIIANRSESIAAVRRGNRISIYSTEGTPELLTSIPRFGFNPQVQRQDHQARAPVFLACDFNPLVPQQLASLDDTYELQIHDFVTEKTLHRIDFQARQVNADYGGPNFTLNRSCGLQFAFDPFALYCYFKNKVYFFDRREKVKILGEKQGPQLHTLLDLSSDVCTRAISNQRYFTPETKDAIVEYISCLQRSHNSNYYYVGTSKRLVLMDWRVPKHAVIQLSHGMRSPAAFIDATYNKNFETVVTGSQRNPEIFSAVLDFAHVACQDRAECKARNPILQSYPRHLSNSRAFWDAATEDGIVFPWEDDHQAVMQRCNAWCTGISVGELSTRRENFERTAPGGIFVVSTNAFGDVFYQEWTRRDDDELRLLHRSDSKWKGFLMQWKDSMLSKEPHSSLKPSRNKYEPEDCTLLVEPCAEALRTVTKVREEEFRSTVVDEEVYYEAKKSIVSLSNNCEKLKRFKGDRVNPFVKVWEEDWNSEMRKGRMRGTASGSSMGNQGGDTTEEETHEDYLVPQVIMKEEPNDGYSDFESEVQIIPLDTGEKTVETVNLNALLEEQDNVFCGPDYLSFNAGHSSHFLHSTPVSALAQDQQPGNQSFGLSFFGEDHDTINTSLSLSNSWNGGGIHKFSTPGSQSTFLSASFGSRKRAGF